MSLFLRSTRYMWCLYGSANRAAVSRIVIPKSFIATNNVILQGSAIRSATLKESKDIEYLIQKLNSNIRMFRKITIRDINELLAAIKVNNNITSVQSLLLIQSCGHLLHYESPEQKTLLVQKIWKHLKKTGVLMDVSHYNVLLQVYLDNEHSFSPSKFLEEMEQQGLQPNRVTYQRIIWRYCQKGELDEATQVLNKMKELNMSVSESVLNAFVMGHAFQGDINGAKGIMDTMENAGLNVSNDTYTLLACGYARKGDISGIQDVIRTAKNKDISLTDRDLLYIIKYLAFGGHEDKIDNNILSYLPKGSGYNQDARTFIDELLQKGFEATARKILATMIEPIVSKAKESKGSFYIQILVKLDIPVNQLVEIIRQLQIENLVSNAILNATVKALVIGKTELALELFKELQKDGHKIREHYYWPLLARKQLEKDEEGLLQIVRNMYASDVEVSGETSDRFILPFLLKKNPPQNVIIKLQIAGMPRVPCVRIVFKSLLLKGDMKTAADIALQYPLIGKNNMTRNALLRALKQNKDVTSFVKILQVLYYNQDKYSSSDSSDSSDSEGEIGADTKEIGEIIKNAVDIVGSSNYAEKLLAAVVAKGIRIPTDSAKAIENSLGNKITTEISKLLEQLTSPALRMAPMEYQVNKESRPNISSAHLEDLLHTFNESNILKNQLLLAYIEEGNIDKVRNQLEKFKSNDMKLSTATMIKLYKLYCLNGLVDKANDIKAQIKARNVEFHLNNDKVLMAVALLKDNRYDEAIQYLKENAPSSAQTGPIINNTLERMFNICIEQKDEIKVKELTTVLLENSYIMPSSMSLAPLIRMHIFNNNIDKALEEYEICCTQYKCTPLKNVFMKILIKENDIDKLQWLADISAQVHGKANITYDTALSFIECGRVQQARRSLQKLNLQKISKRIKKSCRQYCDGRRPECLEGLLEATKGFSNFDRTYIFHQLLILYCKENSTDKALNLWQRMQEDNQIPSNEFLRTLGDHLRRKNIEIPFVLPGK